MVATPDPLEHPPSPALPTSTRPTSLDHESTMEITSALPDSRLDEVQPPDPVITPEKEKQSDGSTEESPPMSSPIQLIGINYVPPRPIEVQTTSQPGPQDTTPWESGAASPLSEDYVVIGLPTFPPKPCVCSTPTSPSPCYTPILWFCSYSHPSAAPGKQDVVACRFRRTVLGHRDVIRCTIHHLWDGLGYTTRERSCASNEITREAR